MVARPFKDLYLGVWIFHILVLYYILYYILVLYSISPVSPLVSFSSDRKDISKTRNGVSPHFQTLKYFATGSFFSTLFLKGSGHAILGNFSTDQMVIELTKI